MRIPANCSICAVLLWENPRKSELHLATGVRDNHSMRAQVEPHSSVRDLRREPWTVNPSCSLETSVLGRPPLATWAGLRVGLFQAVSHESVGFYNEAGAIAMILKGRTRSQMRVGGRDYAFSAGPDALGLFPAATVLDYQRWDCSPGAERLIVELDFAQISALGDLDALNRDARSLQLQLGFRDPQLAALMRLMADEVRSGSPHGDLYAASLSLSLVSYLFAHHGQGRSSNGRERGGLNRIQKERALEFIREHLAEKIELADLAAVAGVSRFHFLRIFKNTFDVTPHKFVQNERLEAARRLLQDTSMPLAQIATATGFSSQSHLCDAMRQATGSTPGQWRRTVPCHLSR